VESQVARRLRPGPSARFPRPPTTTARLGSRRRSGRPEPDQRRRGSCRRAREPENRPRRQGRRRALSARVERPDRFCECDDGGPFVRRRYYRALLFLVLQLKPLASYLMLTATLSSSRSWKRSESAPPFSPSRPGSRSTLRRIRPHLASHTRSLPLSGTISRKPEMDKEETPTQILLEAARRTRPRAKGRRPLRLFLLLPLAATRTPTLQNRQGSRSRCWLSTARALRSGASGSKRSRRRSSRYRRASEAGS
jgi:hypothetical protein